MIRSRRGFKTLGLCVFALGLMTFGGTAAQAEVGATWRVNGAAIPGAADLLPQLVVKEIENKTASLLFVTKGGTHVLLLCTAAQFDEGGRLIAQGTISLGAMLFTGCVILLNEVLAPNCKPKTSGRAAGELLTLKFNGLIVLDVGNDLVKITPETAAGAVSRDFLHIELGELCAIGEEFLIQTTALGEGLWIKDIGGNAGFLAETITHLIAEANAPLHKLLALGQPALIIGSAVIGLGGIHTGLQWSGVPA